MVIIESSRVGWGASGRNGGQIILGFSCDMPPFEKALGADGAQQIWNLTRNAAAEIRRRPAIVDSPVGKGRVVAFATNPCYRWQNHGEFGMLFNAAVLFWNDTPAKKPVAPATAAADAHQGAPR